MYFSHSHLFLRLIDMVNIFAFRMAKTPGIRIAGIVSGPFPSYSACCEGNDLPFCIGGMEGWLPSRFLRGIGTLSGKAVCQKFVSLVKGNLL